MKKIIPLLILGALVLHGCGERIPKDSNQIHTLQIIDRNGFNETISNPDRLKKYEKADFLSPQPYQKAVRVFERSQDGTIPSIVTSYHDNGQVRQYLEMVSGRAHGRYLEWFPSGQLHIQANVVEGLGDLTETAQESWVFDGENLVYDEEGYLIASILYDKGKQSGEARYFYKDGSLLRTVPYVMDHVDGPIRTYDRAGNLIGENVYERGVLHGQTYFKGDGQTPPYEELYQEGLLIEATYRDKEGAVVAEVKEGQGFVAIFEAGKLRSLNEYREGVPEGQVKLYTKEGFLESSFMVKEGIKHGEETVYYLPKRKTLNYEPIPKLSLHWQDDEIQGMMKTWYPDGTLESQREMTGNKKHGMSFAWYKDGTLMLVEEYEDDKLIKGSYMKRGEPQPASRIENGAGTATLFDGEGAFLKRIKYENGKPQEN